MVDYSKWKDIEVSDDEDETHPNIDTPSLFRWRHQARLERMAEAEQKKQELEAKKREQEEKIKKTKSKLVDAEKGSESVNMKQLQASLQDLEKEAAMLKQKEEEIKKQEKLTPWNVDTLSRDGFSKTVINKPPSRKDEGLTEEEKEQRMRDFVKKHEPELKKYGMLKKFDDSRRYLQEHPNLVSEDTANYLVVWCINLEMEDKHELMEHVAHQCICMQYMLELSKQMDIDPRACISSFFKRIQIADQEYKDAFYDELRAFKERIRKRAKEKLEDLIREVEEEEKQARLGPGGLDPLEVLESLPEALKKCFEAQDIPLLQKTITEMPEEEARYHMKRCVDSGLWVPDAKKQQTDTETEPEPETE